ncbi:MAG: tRNA (guanosine(37)-N1)-methyltransferase TrmD [Candidatus Sungiibacteriota bacterium]|uniref:tRNA (guanine-N(1)-)-methyltransferase n=1 Tax=Candidatus Sungiibacteriota bacterium TaxID=2750080 RepID=A0A7T5RJ50_9BACT|nr:MAG: tRNA (guanosine(37)-N1)-methyltransferase TrmD [Candidatus Sungbacteria bacterium]
MRFNIVTIFPNIFDSYLNESMMKRARAKKLVDVRVHDLRNFSRDRHRKVDDRPYGGGPGMVIKIEPLARALGSILKSKIKNQKSKIVLFSVNGKQFTQKMAHDWAKKYDRLIMISGHYEGVDERIFSLLKAKSYKLEAISIGPYVLTGGELPAMVVIDAVSRHIPGVLGKEESLEERRYGVGIPVYTRPEIFKYKEENYRVPGVLLSGDHKNIEKWRKGHKK